jgi:hypothetical protein
VNASKTNLLQCKENASRDMKQEPPSDACDAVVEANVGIQSLANGTDCILVSRSSAPSKKRKSPGGKFSCGSYIESITMIFIWIYLP